MTSFATLLPLVEGGFEPLKVVTGAGFWTLLIFVLSLPFMWKNVFGPITKALAERDERAESAIAKADAARAGAEKAQFETERQLEAARLETQRQIREAKERAEKQAQELLAKAHQEAEASRQKAVAEIDAERRRAIAEIRDLSVDVSLNAASKLMKRDMSGKDQKTFVKDFLSKVEALKN